MRKWLISLHFLVFPEGIICFYFIYDITIYSYHRPCSEIALAIYGTDLCTGKPDFRLLHKSWINQELDISGW